MDVGQCRRQLGPEQVQVVDVGSYNMFRRWISLQFDMNMLPVKCKTMIQKREVRVAANENGGWQVA